MCLIRVYFYLFFLVGFHDNVSIGEVKSSFKISTWGNFVPKGNMLKAASDTSMISSVSVGIQ